MCSTPAEEGIDTRHILRKTKRYRAPQQPEHAAEKPPEGFDLHSLQQMQAVEQDQVDDDHRQQSETTVDEESAQVCTGQSHPVVYLASQGTPFFGGLLQDGMVRLARNKETDIRQRQERSDGYQHQP